MSCDAVAAAAVLWMASMNPAQGPDQVAMILTSAPAPAASTPSSVAQEPLFMDIVRRARALKAEAERLQAAAGAAPVASLPGYAAFRQRIAELAVLDMQGHTTLAQRNSDGDLKCILRGISQDLPTRIQAVEAASTPAERQTALRDMVYLLNDNVEVITSPPRPAV